MILTNLRQLTSWALLFAGTIAGTAELAASDWPEWRGPSRDGRSAETNLPTTWSIKGENLAWRIPIGGRSAPVAFGNRLYVVTTAGDPANTRSRRATISSTGTRERGGMARECNREAGFQETSSVGAARGLLEGAGTLTAAA